MSLTESYRGGMELRGYTGLLRDTPSPGSDSSQPLDTETIARYGERLQELSHGRSLANDLSLYKIQSGLNTMGSIIKIVTTVLSLFGADSVDRIGDNGDSQFSQLLQLVTTALQVGLATMPAPSPVSSVFSSKVGGGLTEQQMAHKQQVQSLVASLTPAQLEAKRVEVAQHVSQQASQQGLSEVEASQLLQETLLYNGLTQTDQAPATISSSGEAVPGLPVPGTLEHTITLALFNAQQSINRFLSGSSQPPIENKLGVAAGTAGAAGAAEGDGGIVSAVSSLPTSLSNAAVQVLKFINPASKEKTEPSLPGMRPGQSYSEVVTGVDPTYAALGVLTTGALASVAYSYVASDSDIASSATDLALGAVDAIARNDIVQNIAKNDIVRKASSAIGSLTGMSSDEDMRDPSGSYYYYDYDKLGYSDYDYDLNQNYQYMEPQERYSKKDPLYPSDQPDRTLTPEKIEWYEPAVGSSDSVPYVAYKERHNPWALLSQGKPTDHLYRSL